MKKVNITRQHAPALLFPISLMLAGNAMALEPAAIDAGPIQFIPQMNVQVGYDDNIYSTENDSVDSVISVLNPSIQAILEKGLNVYSLNYALKQGIYGHGSADNYTDHDLSAQALLDFNIRNRMELLVRRLDTHENRGSGLNQGSAATANDAPIEYHVDTVSAKYAYGAETAKGIIEVAADLNDRKYDNFRSQTAVKDRQVANSSATFYYRVMPKTSLLFEVSKKDIDYDRSSVTLDSQESKYLVGATWDATAKTSGKLKFGYAEKNFDSASREDDEGISWELSMLWSPKTYSVVDIATSKVAEETDGTGNYIDSTSLDLQWTHSWSDVWRTRASFGASTKDYVSSDREDDLRSYGAGIDYDMRRWLSLGLDYAYTEQDSNQLDLDYEKNTVYLTAQISL
uniref:outer membrane beta-barrel protein n=1 Tax=Marinobacterium profundum TaxID=1714300 RepID=UPI00082E97A6|nr:outer membrane beta-barrel protein [Marinobacterium profundum]